MNNLTEKIKHFALNDAGFDLVGVASAVLPEKYGQAIEAWIEKGYAGDMDYMVRDGGKRAHPEQSLASARSVISLGVNYFHSEDEKPAGEPVGKVSKYAYGADYHKVIEKKLKKLGEFVRQTGGAGTEVKSYVDTGPISEKAFAKEAGLGFFGKNTNIITRNYGSWVFLASLITNLDLVYDEPHPGSCGSCRLCIDACPTDAILDGYQIDARRCVSYLTIESKKEVAEELKRGVGEWIFGCDICQDVCPYNYRAKETQEEGFIAKKAGTWIRLEYLNTMTSDESFREMFRGSPVKRPKRFGISRNVAVVAGNLNAKK